jgi:hypothetical protein
LFTFFGGLELIAAFSSMTFLLVSLGVSLANIKLYEKTSSNLWLVITGSVLLSITIGTLIVYLWRNSLQQLLWIGSLYLLAVFSDMLFKKEISLSNAARQLPLEHRKQGKK